MSEFLIGCILLLFIIGVVVISNLMKKDINKHVKPFQRVRLDDNEETIQEQEEDPVLDPPALPTLPDIPAWEYMNCEDILQELINIQNMLMTSKLPQYEYEFWMEQLQKGDEVYKNKCQTEINEEENRPLS